MTMLIEAEWKKYDSLYMHPTDKVKDAATRMLTNDMTHIPLVNEENKPVGFVVMKDILRMYTEGKSEETKVEEIMQADFYPMYTTLQIENIIDLAYDCIMVVHEDGTYAGMLVQNDIQPLLTEQTTMLDQYDYKASTLKVILETAFEGIAVVDENGILIEFNEPYARFMGVNRENALGRHVTEVIDNTQLHKTVKNGIPERNVLQHIQGQDMIVHRIPIWHGDEVIGAIGMLIFEGVSEVYHVYRKLQQEKEYLLENKRQSVASNEVITMDKIIGTSEQAAALKRKVRKVAQTNVPVLITGEKGTGKEMFARSIHQLGPYEAETFTVIDCRMNDETTLFNKLFGSKEVEGILRKNGGTVYIEHIDFMSENVWESLVQQLRLNDAAPAMATEMDRPRLRVILSSINDIEGLEAHHPVRKEIQIVHLHMPALKDRKKDITYLLSHYTEEYCIVYQVAHKTYTSEAVQALLQYDWPGNVEELMKVVEQLVLQVQVTEIDLHHLPEKMQFTPEPSTTSWLEEIKERKLAEERNMILTALSEARGNKTQAANLLGMHRTTLYKKLKELEIES